MLYENSKDNPRNGQDKTSPSAVSTARRGRSAVLPVSVCGSFGVQANAQNLCDYLQSQGYKAGIVKNVQKNMFRVIVGSWNTKAEAVSAREAFKAKFPGRSDFQESWILWNK